MPPPSTDGYVREPLSVAVGPASQSLGKGEGRHGTVQQEAEGDAGLRHVRVAHAPGVPIEGGCSDEKKGFTEVKYSEGYITTSLSVRECADWFQDATLAVQGIGSKLGGAMQRATGSRGLDYFTPTNDSPFASLDDDPASFSIGVLIPTFGPSKRDNRAIHMHVWERDGHRDLELHAPYGNALFKAGASKLARAYCEQFFLADPDARIVLDDGTALERTPEAQKDEAGASPREPPDAVAVDARWAADPYGRHQLRYWNGHRWTQHVSDAGVTGIDQP